MTTLIFTDSNTGKTQTVKIDNENGLTTQELINKAKAFIPPGNYTVQTK